MINPSCFVNDAIVLGTLEFNSPYCDGHMTCFSCKLDLRLKDKEILGPSSFCLYTCITLWNALWVQF